MKKFFCLAFLVACAGLACTLTAQTQPQTGAVIRQIQNATVTWTFVPSTPIPQATKAEFVRICQVKTGLVEGRLNVRACSGLACRVLDVIHEGETLTPTISKTVNGWLEIQTADGPSTGSGHGLRGWVNSKFTTCLQAGINEVTK